MNSYNYDYSAPTSAAVGGGMMAIFGAMLLIWLLVMAAIYIYFAICLMKIAKKTNTPNAWFAWIPILNLILMIQVAKKPMWWIIMFFIPFVNIIFSILIWMGVAEAVGKPSWVGVLMIVPIANVIVPGYLAFSKMDSGTPNVMAPPVPPIQPVV
ncbi:MAG: DUF5684 domain-containing protein [Patescibacteria group bacterium]